MSDRSVSAGDYFLEVESHFAQRRGTPFVFSAKDWALLKQWQGEGIPLAVVIEAIDSSFDKSSKTGRRRTISSLTYCKHAVKDLWEERKDLLVGSEASLPELDPRGRLEVLAEQLQLSGSGQAAQLSEVLSRAASTILSIRPTSAPQIEEALMHLEQQMIAEVLSALDDESRRSIDEELDRALSGYEDLGSDVLNATREANLRRLLRARLAIPRLTLFA